MVKRRPRIYSKHEYIVDTYPVRYTEVMVKQSVKRTTTKKSAKKVDFEPNKMALAVSALAAVSLVLLGVMTLQ